MRSVFVILAALALALLVAPACSDDGTQTSDGPAKNTEAGNHTDLGSPDGFPTNPLVTTGSGPGPVRGVATATARAFLGIPYAAPPTGSDRFKPPQPKKAWSTELAATKYGPSCIQDPKAGLGLPKNYSEDCLTLNVFSPNPAPASPAPVMISSLPLEPAHDRVNFSVLGDVHEHNGRV